MLAILGSAGLGKDLKVDEAHGHETKSEAGHQAGKEYQKDDYEYVDEEIGAATFVFDGHSIQRKRNLKFGVEFQRSAVMSGSITEKVAEKQGERKRER